ncbi:hypothetical protein CEUSTIGMA_g3885.t1 [Chlamydomonas eustigma]|uniref:J domain-containing protein n=1 Tax=Chlamydomonas eustigma TaxID=1157962 RepID=A0A250X113_9CHLO|nr:hypothetical protein CEUSTIGMA_g3885.t1 [Chlamydomonas eustigma]|eukprot:GAX76440.1 hypothetical protein CEUSTIGMA_g3885.t1 [Chlamydomonas eustigma]
MTYKYTARGEAAQASKNWSSGADEDLDGRSHYRYLNVDRNAAQIDIRHAYRVAARLQHPDKGGDPAIFSKIQTAYQVLSDPAQRRVYDMMAYDVRLRYAREHMQPEERGGEAALLAELDSKGVVCDSKTQLVVTCEVCRRPATITCWVCTAAICTYCIRRQHFKGVWPLHWPVVNSSHMEEKLARREMERKRKEDEFRFELEDPDYMPPSHVREARLFKEAAMFAFKDQLQDCLKGECSVDMKKVLEDDEGHNASSLLLLLRPLMKHVPTLARALESASSGRGVVHYE